MPITALLIRPGEPPVFYPLSGIRTQDRAQIFGEQCPVCLALDSGTAVLMYLDDPSLPENRAFLGTQYHGTLLVVGRAADKPCSLSAEQREQYMAALYAACGVS